MTIDEAIKHCNEVAAGALCEGTVNHKACGEEHKQLGIWLEELKRTREQLKANAIHSMAQNVEGLEEGEPQCPNCGEELSKWDEYSYCPSCAQALSWDYPDEDIPEEE